MKTFKYHQSTEIIFGSGQVCELPGVVKRFGTKALLVTTPGGDPALQEQYQRITDLLTRGGIEVVHFDGVVPNPTVESVSAGAKMAREAGAEVIIGLGGGSSMDSAKAISVEATHPGSCWDYLFFKEQPDPAKLLPVIAVSTTSGTGSQVTQVAVVTHTGNRDKSALYNNILYPQVAIVDPELMLTVPPFVTACTGFDVFCHAFESILHPGAGAYVELMGWQAIELVLGNLPRLVENPADLEAREKMAWADTLAGLCIANAGVTLPHGMGMAIGGMYPQVAHGEALAIVYPAFADFTVGSAIPQFARIARLMNSKLFVYDDAEAASNFPRQIAAFLEHIGLRKTLSEVGVPENELEALAKQCMVLPDYQANPRVTTPEEMLELVKKSF